MKNLILLAVSGAAGTISRYGLNLFADRVFPESFVTGTLLANLTGCLLFGFVWGLANISGVLEKDCSFFILVGFMGAFTTFSTFMFETGEFIKDSNYLLALANIALQTILGLAVMYVGMVASKLVARG